MEVTTGCQSEAKTPSKPGILDLPLETQHNIFKHCLTSDLIALALVSRHFNEIASAQLYRHFLIYFDDEDTIEPEPWDDALASILDSMVTSDRKYAKHLRNLNFDSPNGGKKGEREYRDYSYKLSCGKFMNTLLVLVVREAKALETFHWNIRIEISPSLFQALHGIPTLRNLHVRLQRGPPMFKTLKPLPPSLSFHVGHTQTSLPSLMPPTYCSHQPISLEPKLPHVSKPHKPRETSLFSEFSSLKSLSILDIDDLYYIDGIATCLRSSSSTLKHLKLSLSEDMASKSRKPPIPDSDESDQDVDDFGIPLPPHSNDWTQEKEAAAKKELKVQESLLSSVLGVNHISIQVQSKADDAVDNEDSLEPEGSIKNKDDIPNTESELARAFVTNLKAITEKLLNSTRDSYAAGERLKAQKETLELIEKAAAKYVNSREKDERETDSTQGPVMIHENIPVVISTPSDEDKSHGNLASETGDGAPKAEKKAPVPPAAVPQTKRETSTSAEPEDAIEEPGLFDKPQTTSKSDTLGLTTEVSSPDDINIDIPDDIEEDEDEIATPGAQLSQDATIDKDDEVREIAQKLAKSAITETESGGNTPLPAISGNGDKTDDPEASVETVSTPHDQPKAETRTKPKSIGESREYILSTRGLALESLSLYLIPIKASILSKAVDLTVLTRVTLLNVGPQDAFWTLMAKENKTTPLPLHCVFSDNVTLGFLSCLKELNKVTDLFMLERNSEKPDVESLAPKTNVTMDDMRKLVLRRHAKHLRRLLIKNEHVSDVTWEMDGKTILMLARKSSKLEELAVSLELRSYHLLLQNISGLASLRALHILRINVHDSCPSVLQEIRKGVIDSVSHHSNLKLEYIACDNTIDRIRRRDDEIKRHRNASKAFESKRPEVEIIDKGKARLVDDPTTTSETNTGLSDSWDSEAEESDHPLLKLDLRETKFYRTGNLRIFRKDIRAGKL